MPIYKQIEDAFNEDSGKQRLHVLPQYAEELAKSGCPDGLRSSLLLHTLPDRSGKYKPGSKTDPIPEMERHPSISPERTWSSGQAFLASAGRLVIGPTTYFFAKKDGKETTCEPKKLTTITACAPNLSGRSAEDMAKFTMGTGEDCKFTDKGLELYKAHCQMLADFIVSSAKHDGKNELIMPDFGLGLYINALNDDGKKQAREAMLTAFSEASKKYEIKINWILYAQDSKRPSSAAVDQKKMYDEFLAKQAGGAGISVKLGDIFHEIHEAAANAAVLNPGSERTIGGDYANTAAMSLEEIFAASSTLLGGSAALAGRNMPVFVSQGNGTYSDTGVTVATFDKVVNECAAMVSAAEATSAATVRAPGDTAKEESTTVDALEVSKAVRFILGNAIPPLPESPTVTGECAVDKWRSIVFRADKNKALVSDITTCLKELGVPANELRTGQEGRETGRAALQVSPDACEQIMAMAAKKRLLIKILNDFSGKYTEKLPPEREKPDFFTTLTKGHGEGRALIKDIEKLEGKSFSEIQTIAQKVANHIEKNEKNKKAITSEAKVFKPILDQLSREGFGRAKPGATAASEPLSPKRH